MNWIEKVVTIKQTLSQHGHAATAARITAAQMVLGTPGEMYLEVMNELLRIRRASPDEYQLIEPEVNELIQYGRSINYFHARDE